MQSAIKNVFQKDPLVIKIPQGSTVSSKTLHALQGFAEFTGLRACTFTSPIRAEKSADPDTLFQVEWIDAAGKAVLDDELLCWFFETLMSFASDSNPALPESEQTEWQNSIRYEQQKYHLYQKYCENLSFIYGSHNKVVKTGFGFREVSLISKDTAFVRSFFSDLPAGNLSVSMVRAPFCSQLKPVLIDFDEVRPQQDRDLQKNIANAYWQTCWATGAIRGSRGDTEPVVFFPVGWREKGTFRKEIEPGKYITSSRFYQFYRLNQAVLQGAVSYDPRKEKFSISGILNNRNELQEILDSSCFCDLYQGQNKERREPFVLLRAVPVIGSHLLSRVITERLGLEGKPENIPYAGSNSVFFLNFPEEYPFYYTVMNAPVGLLVHEGEIYQPPLLKRGCLYYEKGKAHIDIFSLKNVEIELPDGSCWKYRKEKDPGEYIFESDNDRECRIYSPFRMVHHDKTPASNNVEITVVSNQMVEVNSTGGNPVPQNGFVMSLREENIDWKSFSHFKVYFKVRKNGQYIYPDNALSCGPVLLNNGQQLPADFFDIRKQLNNEVSENFLPFVEGANYKPLVPTRFPHVASEVRAPRTFIGIKNEEVFLFVVDGRSTEEHSIGMTLREESFFLSLLGCKNGLNLDGGGSTVLWVREKKGALGHIVNLPSDKGHQERLMPVPIVLE